MVANTATPGRTWFWLNVFLAVFLLTPAMYGFGTKFHEFLVLYGGYLHHQAEGHQVMPPSPGDEPPAPPKKVPARGVAMTDEATEGAFALMPILNYLIVSLGFMLLFTAAVMRGMFHNIEQPKQDMLIQEELLEEMEQAELAQDHPEIAAVRREGNA